MRTAGEIAQRALLRAGVIAAGETPTAAEIMDAVTTLADMMDSWSLENLTVFGPADVVVPLTGAPSYALGPGSGLAFRPNAVLSAFVRSQGGDHPVHVASDSLLDAASDKGATGDAYWMAFTGDMPDARVRLWPAQASGELHLRVTRPVAEITDPGDDLILPPGWFTAMTLNLAVELCEEYGFVVPAALADSAREAKGNIKRVNIRPAVAVFDVALR